MLVEATSKAFPLNEEALRKWAKREGIFLHPEAAFLVKTQTMGMGVFAKRGIGKGQTVISCPHTAYVAPMDEKVHNAPAAAAISQYRFNSKAILAAATDAVPAAASGSAEESLVDWTRTVLRLMAEVLRADSPWRPWLQCCPRMPDSLFGVPLPAASSSTAGSSSSSNLSSSTQQQQDIIFGLPDFLKVSAAADASPAIAVITGAAQQLQDLDIEKQWLLSKPLLDANPDIWPAKIPAHCNALPLSAAQQQALARAAAAPRPAGAPPLPIPAPRIECLKDLFLECAAQVTSRNFHRESQDRPGPYLLPTIDFLNHSADRKNVDFQIHGGGGGKRHVTFDVIATRDILPKEQIFHDYGSLSAARFLVEFQFVLHAKSLAADEGLRWSKEALSTLVALLYTNGNKQSGNGDKALTYAQKYKQCLDRCTYLIRNDLFLFEEGIIFSGGTNEAVGGGSAENASGYGSSGGGGATVSNGVVDLKAAVVIDYSNGQAIIDPAAYQHNGAVGTGGGQQARTDAANRAERIQLEMQYLTNTLFLLAVTDVCFDGLKPHLSRHWTVMDVAKSRRDLEASTAGQKVVVELGCPIGPKFTAANVVAAANAGTDVSAAIASAAASGPTATNADVAVADDLTLAAVPFYGAFSVPSFKVGPTVLKEISTDRLEVIVNETLTKPFLAAYRQVLSHQIELLKDASEGAAAPFPTKRTGEMVGQVLAHELTLMQKLEASL